MRIATNRLLAALALCVFATVASANDKKEETPASVRAVTKGPKHHWFAYYDKLQFDPTGRLLLGMEVDFEGRSPRAEDAIAVGMVDLADSDKWIELGASRAWSWQQGCMLQWIPGSKSKMLWNDREGDRFVSHILDAQTRKKQTIPHPIYAISPNGHEAVAPDFRRIQDMRPGYGYAGPSDPHKETLAPKDSGIFHINLETGKSRLLISLAKIAALPYDRDDLSDAKHYFNHLLFSPNGQRFIFLHRWRKPGQRSFGTRMLTASINGDDIRVVDSYGKTSHFIWRDPNHILAWAWHPSSGNAFYLYEDSSDDQVEVIGKNIMTKNGHCTYLPGNKWILNDTYPSGPTRSQQVYLYNIASSARVNLGAFPSPAAYTGEWRVDTHPRFSPDGGKVCIDSPHGGNGRQMYLLDIEKIVE